MRKLFMLSACIMMIISTASCQKKEYKQLGDGVFADIQTSKGNMIVKLNYKETPITVANFVSLAEGTNTYVADSLKGKPYYDGVIFHRVIKDFMIQGGDRTGTGMGSPGYQFDDEFVDSLVMDKKGILAMANSGPATNGSQFFITHKETPWLNGRHTVFGTIVKGLDVIDSIATTKTGPGDKPVTPVVIKHIEIVKNGKDAKAFDAAVVFKKSVEEKERKEKEAQAKREAASKEVIKDVASQKEQAVTTDSGVQIYYYTKSNGVQPKQGDQVLVNYAGYVAATGSLFDSNHKDIAEKFGMYDERREQMNGYQPIPMPYDPGANLIPGFKEALLQLKVGDNVRIFIPAYLGLGARGGARGLIPPNADLFFDVEIMGIVEAPKQN